MVRFAVGLFWASIYLLVLPGFLSSATYVSSFLFLPIHAGKLEGENGDEKRVCLLESKEGKTTKEKYKKKLRKVEEKWDEVQLVSAFVVSLDQGCHRMTWQLCFHFSHFAINIAIILAIRFA